MGAKMERAVFHFSFSIVHGSAVSADVTGKEFYVNWLEDEMSIYPFVGLLIPSIHFIDTLADWKASQF